MVRNDLNSREWRVEDERGAFLVTTRPELLDHDFIQTSFGSKEMYWARPLEKDQLVKMLEQSVTLGLYERTPSVPPAASSDEPSSPRTPSPTLEAQPRESMKQIGLARLITDHVSTVYLTDVYVLPDHRNRGLARWLIACCKELIEAHPALRRAFLVANPDVGKAFYKRELGFWDSSEEQEHIVIMTKRGFKLGET